MVVIQQGFSDAQRAEVAALFDAAFGEKMSVAIADRRRRQHVLSDGFVPEYCFVALANQQLIGMAGFKTESGALTGGIDWALLRRHLGIIGALRSAAIFSIYERGLSSGELLMDGISVAPGARGRGIGTQLLNQLKLFARDRGFESIRLDVINTNPQARRLYERLGFRETATVRFPYLKWLLGFSSATTLQYDVVNSGTDQ